MRAKKHRKYHMGLVTRQGAEKSLSEVSEKKFRVNYSVPPTVPDQAVEAKVKMYHNSIFIAGTFYCLLLVENFKNIYLFKVLNLSLNRSFRKHVKDVKQL